MCVGGSRAAGAAATARLLLRCARVCVLRKMHACSYLGRPVCAQAGSKKKLKKIKKIESGV
jgi:hypothetical protein